jgi:hypothetical protein
LALASLLAPSLAHAFEVVLNLRAVGTLTGWSGVTRCAILVGTPSGNDVWISPSSGLGHAGGQSDTTVDSGELVTLSRAFSARGAGYRVTSAADPDGDGRYGESFVEAFQGLASLGVLPVDGTGLIDVDALFGAVPVSRVHVTAVESIRIDRVQWEVPEGETASLFLGLSDAGGPYTYASPLQQCGFTLTTAGSFWHSDEGIGIFGGASDRVDAGETMHVGFGGPLADVTYFLGDATDVGGSGAAGDHFVEAFDQHGASLGLRSGTATDDGVALSALHGGALLSGFDLIGVNDSFLLKRIQVTPEAGLGSGAAALLSLLALRRRRY